MAQKHPGVTRIRAAKNRRLKTAALKKEKLDRRASIEAGTSKPAQKSAQ